MNDVIVEYLRKFILVFFDNILIYSRSLEDHEEHLEKVLETLCRQQLYAKQSKCYFGQQKVEYLGYIITLERVAIDPTKVEAMVNWSIPTSLKGPTKVETMAN